MFIELAQAALEYRVAPAIGDEYETVTDETSSSEDSDVQGEQEQVGAEGSQDLMDNDFEDEN